MTVDLTDTLDRRCPCEVGACTSCAPAGDCARCSEVLAPARPGPAAWLRRGQHGMPLLPLFERGHGHRPVCACHRAGHGAITSDPRKAVQLELFDGMEATAA